MAWIFFQKTGRLYHNADVYVGYSGHDAGRNNPAMENVKGIGPVPRGNYTMYGVHSSEKTGPVTIRLRPDDATRARIEAMGRDPDSFEIHGDNAEGNASHGCLIFIRVVRMLIAAAINTEDDQLRVEADLPTTT
jgi:hypothetical protein